MGITSLLQKRIPEAFYCQELCKAVSHYSRDAKPRSVALPRRNIFWESLPKSAHDKITKKLVRDELLARCSGFVPQPAADGRLSGARPKK